MPIDSHTRCSLAPTERPAPMQVAPDARGYTRAMDGDQRDASDRRCAHNVQGALNTDHGVPVMPTIVAKRNRAATRRTAGNIAHSKRCLPRGTAAN